MTDMPAVVTDLGADDRRDGGIVNRIGGKAERARPLEGDPRVNHTGADVLDWMVGGPPVSFDPRLRRRLDGVVAMRLRAPDAAAQWIARMPVEPPIDHLSRDRRHLGAHGDVADSVEQSAPVDLRRRRGDL